MRKNYVEQQNYLHHSTNNNLYKTIFYTFVSDKNSFKLNSLFSIVLLFINYFINCVQLKGVPLFKPIYILG